MFTEGLRIWWAQGNTNCWTTGCLFLLLFRDCTLKSVNMKFFLLLKVNKHLLYFCFILFPPLQFCVCVCMCVRACVCACVRACISYSPPLSISSTSDLPTFSFDTLLLNQLVWIYEWMMMLCLCVCVSLSLSLSIYNLTLDWDFVTLWLHSLRRQQCMQSIHLETALQKHTAAQNLLYYIVDHYLPSLNCCIFSATHPVSFSHTSI